ncbi:hypothetical protein GCM10009426_07790 [Rheinheimera tangshanensis]|jgi:hypothetical protein|nr:hypothetical protein GCM10010920_07650 [Rheinheimera tangshanensis]
MDEIMSSKKISIELTEQELSYLISCGAALLQNIPEESLQTYCSFSKEQIIEFIVRLRGVAEEHGM